MDSSLIALYFEATGSSGAGADTSINSGETLRMLPATGSGDIQNHWSVAITLPVIAVNDTNRITRNGTLNASPALAVQMTVTMYRGSAVAIALPVPTLAAGITIPTYLRAATGLPLVTAAGHITSTGLMQGAGAIPVMTVSMSRGWSFSPHLLPAVAGVGSIAPNQSVTAQLTRTGLTAARLPPLTGSGHWSQTSGVLHANIILPAIAGRGVSINVRAILLPPLRAAGSMSNGTAAVYQGWAMNLSNKAVTQFTNFPFRQMARAFDRYSMVGFDGNLYDLGGDLDNATAIDWQWRTGISDLGTRGLKGVLGVYVDGIIESGVTVDLVLDTGTYTYKHNPRGVPNNYKQHRISPGRGLRSSNVGLGMAGTCYIAIDSITPEYVVSNRNL